VKTYTVGMVRERLAEALDEAQQGLPVFIERRGVIYRLSVEPSRRPARTKKRAIEIVDRALEGGAWSWDWNPRGKGLQLRPRRRAR
jgi:hypothetical protein